MDEPVSVLSMIEQDRRISEVIAERTATAAEFHPQAGAR